MRLGQELGCTSFNALYGNRQEGEDPAAQDALAVENLAFAARAVEHIGGTVLLEAISGSPTYPLLTAADVAAVIERVRMEQGVTNIRFLCDLYHLAANGDDVVAVCREHAAEVGHCQIADAPGRGEPGTGTLPLADLLASLRAAGYDGWVTLEHKPTVPSAESFGNLPKLN